MAAVLGILFVNLHIAIKTDKKELALLGASSEKSYG